MSRRLPALVLLCGALAATTALAQNAQLGKWGVDLSSMDKSVKPGDNFFNYVNGGWLKTAEIAPARASARLDSGIRLLPAGSGLGGTLYTSASRIRQGVRWPRRVRRLDKIAARVRARLSRLSLFLFISNLCK